ncbi:guanylate kinase [Streptomyces xinghaiensis]|uniref:guanylate kinase n=1 Tax=Streptomyces xinghaiensis TaxID=1038928 RepID=UPI003443616C
MSAIVLYGPPTAGKDTITALLNMTDARCKLVTKLKHGSGRTSGYRFVDADELNALRARDRLVVETRRYGNVYAVDRRDLDEMRSAGLVPVVHIGNIADLRRLLSGFQTEWTRVLLWVSRKTCEERSRLRGDKDTPARLRAWDATASDLAASDLSGVFDLAIRTDEVDASGAVRAVTAALRAPQPACDPQELRDRLDLPGLRK